MPSTPTTLLTVRRCSLRFEKRLRCCAVLAFLPALLACNEPSEVDATRSTLPSPSLDTLAEQYVRLALAFGRHDSDYVDAYFGPPQWREQAESQTVPMSELRDRAQQALGSLGNIAADDMAEDDRLRHAMLGKRLRSMVLRIDMADPDRHERSLSFDEESRILFDAVAPDHDAAHFEEILARIDALIPGEEPLPERVEAFRSEFVVPKDKLQAVFDAAIDECRQRTLRHIELPAEESFEIEYVTDQPWSGYNWYKGDFFSLIQINTDLPIFISRALDLGCHEGYPGHHTYNVVLERDLVNGRGWVEFSVNALYGPQSLISEGSANYGIELAFPGEERLAFEKQVLFPLADLDPSTADRYYELSELIEQLDYAGNEAARDYLNGRMTRAQAVDWLVEYGLSSVQRAEQRTRFFDTYRSYVINYNLGRDLVRNYIESRAGRDAGRRWAELERLLSLPITPSDLLE
jgi:hypothetical protein